MLVLLILLKLLVHPVFASCHRHPLQHPFHQPMRMNPTHTDQDVHTPPFNVRIHMVFLDPRRQFQRTVKVVSCLCGREREMVGHPVAETLPFGDGHCIEGGGGGGGVEGGWDGG